MTENDMDFKGVFIPAEIWFHPELSWTARIILVQIFYLSKNGKGCFASNARLAEFLGLSENYVRNLISKLTQEGYIRQTAKGKDRHMFVTEKTGLIPSQKCDTDAPTSQKCADTSQKSANTSLFCANTSQKSDHKIYKDNKEKREENALTVYREIWPDYRLDIFSSERLETFPCDLDLWRAVVTDWRMNQWKANNLVGMMDLYARKKVEADEASKPSNTAMTYCDSCRDTSGLVKTDGRWIRCSH